MVKCKDNIFDKNGRFIACPQDNDYLIAWAKKVSEPFLKETIFGKLMSNSQMRGVIDVDTRLEHTAGSTIQFKQRTLIRGRGVIGCERLQGREACNKPLVTTARINRARQGVCTSVCGCWGRQINESIIKSRETAIVDLKRWFQSIILTPSFMTQVSGYTGKEYVDANGDIQVLDGRDTGFNCVYAPSSHYAVRDGTLVPISGLNTEEAKIKPTDRMSVKVLNEILSSIGAGCYKGIRPFAGRFKYILMLHPSQVKDLRSDPEWNNILSNADQRGEKNRLFSGELGIYQGMLLVEGCEVLNGLYPDGSMIHTVRRALLLGEEAATLIVGGFCKDMNNGRLHRIPLNIKGRNDDYDDDSWIAMEMIFGIVKNRFDGHDLGVSVISTYADNNSIAQANPASKEPFGFRDVDPIIPAEFAPAESVTPTTRGKK